MIEPPVDTSFQEQFEAFYMDILQYCYMRLRKNQQLSQECCQDVFCIYAKKRPVFSDPSGLRVWLFRTARFCVMRYRRKLQKENAKIQYFGDISEVPEFKDGTYDIDLERVMELPIDETLVKQSVLDKLSSGERELYELYYGSGLSCRDIAAVLKMKENAVHQRLYRLREHIYKHVKELHLT